MSVILFISLIDFVLSSLAWVYYSHAFSFMRSAPFIALYVLLMLNTVGSRVLPESLPLPLLKLSAWLSGYWIAFLYYSLLLMVVHGIVYAVLRIFSFKLPFMQFAAAGAIVLQFLLPGAAGVRLALLYVRKPLLPISCRLISSIK